MVLSAATLAAAFQARHPAIGVLPSVSAAAGTLDQVQAMAIRGYSAPSSKLVWVKASSHFFVSGEIVTIGDYVEIEENEAKRLIRNEQATPASQEEVDAAAHGSKTKAKG